MYSSLWLWIYVARKAHNVNQSQFKQSAGITVTVALLFFSACCLCRSGKLCSPDSNTCRKHTHQQHNLMLLHAVVRNNDNIAIPRYCYVSLSPPPQHMQRGDPAWPHARVKAGDANIFSHLIAACLTHALSCYLQASTFIPTQCDTSPVPPPAAPPCWFRSCLFLSGFYPQALVGDRIILRVVINCIFHFLHCHLHRASCTVDWMPFLWEPYKKQQPVWERRTA